MSPVGTKEAEAHVAACCIATLVAFPIHGMAACGFAIVTWAVVLFWQAQGELP